MSDWETDAHTQRQRDKLVEGATTADDSTTDNSTECVSQQELAAVRKQVDQLHSQIYYWQSINIRNIVQDHCSSQNTTGRLGTQSVQAELMIGVAIVLKPS